MHSLPRDIQLNIPFSLIHHSVSLVNLKDNLQFVVHNWMDYSSSFRSFLFLPACIGVEASFTTMRSVGLRDCQNVRFDLAPLQTTCQVLEKGHFYQICYILKSCSGAKLPTGSDTLKWLTYRYSSILESKEDIWEIL